jgi:hypothetical protein
MSGNHTHGLLGTLLSESRSSGSQISLSYSTNLSETSSSQPRSELEDTIALGPVDESEELAFHCFPKLPNELRLRVWNYVCFRPRYIDLFTRSTSYRFPELNLKDWVPFQYLSHSLPPALLHACKESRIEGLKHYELDFGTSQVAHAGAVKAAVTCDPRIYIHWGIDIPCLIWTYGQNQGQTEFLFEDLSANRPKLQCLALDSKNLQYDWHFWPSYPNLKEVILYWLPSNMRPVEFDQQPLTISFKDIVANLVGAKGPRTKAQRALIRGSQNIRQEMNYYDEEEERLVHEVCSCAGEEGMCTHPKKWHRPTIKHKRMCLTPRGI